MLGRLWQPLSEWFSQRVLPWLVRWRDVVILTGVLFVLNVAGRWAAKLIKADNQIELDERKAMAGLIAIGVIGLVFLALTLYWGRTRPFSRVGFELGAAAVLSCALSVFIGPFTIGESPFRNGAGAFFNQIWTWGGLAIAGVALGYIVLISFTADYRSKQLKRIAERKKVVPKRV